MKLFCSVNRKLIPSVLLSLLIVIVVFVIIFVWRFKERKVLPDYPSFETVHPAVIKQVREAGRMTWLFPTADNIGNLGMVYNANGFYDEARACYRMASARSRDEWIWDYYTGYIDAETGESVSAAESFGRVVDKATDNMHASLYLADALFSIGSTGEAEEIYKGLFSTKHDQSAEQKLPSTSYFPVRAYAGFRLARIYLNDNRYDDSEAVLTRVVEDQVRFGPAYRLLGHLYSLKGDSILSRRFILLANDHDEYTPPYDTLINRLAMMSRSESFLLKHIDDALNNNNSSYALQLCNQAIQYLPDSKVLLSRALNGYFALGYEEKAIPFLNSHFEYFSDDFTELMSMASVLSGKGYMDQALKYFEKAKELNPDNSRLALWLSDAGMRNEALILLNDQITRNPEDVEALTDAVKLVIRLGNYKMAEEYLSRLKAVAPENQGYYKLSGVIAEREGRIAEAILMYDEAYRRGPADREITRYLAEVFERERMEDKAIAHYKGALMTFPNDPVLLEGYGSLLINSPTRKAVNIREGAWYAWRAFFNYMSDYQILLSAGKSLATAYTLTGEPAKAAEYINSTLELAGRGFVTPDFFQYMDSLKNLNKITD
jgi:tetratricopeptide (TPR) repeat protein